MYSSAHRYSLKEGRRVGRHSTLEHKGGDTDGTYTISNKYDYRSSNHQCNTQCYHVTYNLDKEVILMERKSLSRKERKEKANEKRSTILLLIAEYAAEKIKFAQASNMDRPALYAFHELEKFGEQLIKDRPEDAHLIRSAFYEFSKQLRKEAKKDA